MTSRERAEKAYRDVREFPRLASRAVAIIELAIEAAVAEEREACASEFAAHCADGCTYSMAEAIRNRGAK